MCDVVVRASGVARANLFRPLPLALRHWHSGWQCRRRRRPTAVPVEEFPCAPMYISLCAEICERSPGLARVGYTNEPLRLDSEHFNV